MMGQCKNNKVSIIVPAYNVEKYISDCIRSVLRQSYADFELIIVDDGSNDHTLELSRKFADKDERIQVIHQKNGGSPSARNSGLKHATGEYILFLDSDDWLEDDCLEITLKEINQNHADMVFFDYIQEFENKSIPKHSIKQYCVYTKKEDNAFIYDMRTITAWGKLYRRECIKDIKFDEQMRTAEDVDFSFRAYDNVQRAVYLNKPLMHYRVLNSSAIHGYNPEILNKFAYPIDEIRKYMLNGNLTRAKAFYSFLAIAYIVITRNMICLNTSLSDSVKKYKLRELNKIKWVQELFQNSDKLVMPISRKIIIFCGKHGLNRTIIFINNVKSRLDK